MKNGDLDGRDREKKRRTENLGVKKR